MIYQILSYVVFSRRWYKSVLISILKVGNESWEYGHVWQKHTVPCHSAVACLNINSGVSDIASHYIVGEVRFQDVEIGIDSDLEKIRQEGSEQLRRRDNKT